MRSIFLSVQDNSPDFPSTAAHVSPKVKPAVHELGVAGTVEDRETADWCAGLPLDRLTEDLNKETMSFVSVGAFKEKDTAVYLIKNLANDSGRKESVTTKSEDVGAARRYKRLLASIPMSAVGPAYSTIGDDIHRAGPARIDGKSDT
jgi:hypothetical protein